MSADHKRTEQLYLAFHDWRARLERELDRLETDYLQALRVDMQRAVDHIERQLAARSAAAHRDEHAAEPALPTHD